ncbi:MAG: GNAT family N-acetyltransferase [Alphaproteobacteria bacterium]
MNRRSPGALRKINHEPTVAVERLQSFTDGDLADLCDAACDAIEAGGGFGWVTPPMADVLEAYWQGILLVPGRELFVGRLDGVIAGSAQLVHPPKNNEAQAFAASLTTSFVAPWARGHGLARELALAVEREARTCGYEILRLDVRETQTAAIALYESLGYLRWGEDPHYARVDGKVLRGFYYSKALTAAG